MTTKEAREAGYEIERGLGIRPVYDRVDRWYIRDLDDGLRRIDQGFISRRDALNWVAYLEEKKSRRPHHETT